MNKKNKILFFLFSLIPGAAHMYIGLIKRGLVIMLAFVAGAGLAMMTDVPALLLLLPVLWFYSFFDAWNKYHLPEDKLAKVQDDFLFFLNGMPQNMRSDPRFKKVASASVLKIGGIAAVIVGAYLLWDKIIVNVLSRLLSETGAGILSEVSYRLPQIAVAVLLIVIGVKLIMEALHGNTLPFINGGEGVHWVPEVPTWLSLAVIVLAIGGASVASVIKMKSMESAEKA